MGFRVAIIAVHGKSRKQLYAEYGVEPTGAREEIAESPVCGACVSTGWELLYLNNAPRPDSAQLAVLSRQAELLFCDVNETTMTSFATGWSRGTEDWLLFHDGQVSLTHLTTAGDLPDEYAAIRDALVQQQTADADGVDYLFDVPVELFAALTGVRYDRDLPAAEATPFYTLEFVARQQ
ncbi:hypothetical protein [Lignipirellula cremea]|uniref:Uncharacterized protein n=1 Tax=Lignipirellula cremea TaxID=2528010 RepID=A0A518DRT5_9BACT|nr:hypothetical protein [Lignipirellula cremea]QDU94541.1 hypothetical protein Pla8534_23320 [Lignipirellula cremea]